MKIQKIETKKRSITSIIFKILLFILFIYVLYYLLLEESINTKSAPPAKIQPHHLQRKIQELLILPVLNIVILTILMK